MARPAYDELPAAVRAASPGGMPTVRGFQAAQAAVARTWLQDRTGWR